MSFLAGVSAGPTDDGQRIVLGGLEKVGKTTLATNAPRALLIPMEIGYGAVTTPKTNLVTSWSDVEGVTHEIKQAAMRGQFPYKSLVWDTATALERLIHDAVLLSDPTYVNSIDPKTGALKKNAKAVTMESALGGYGKAYSNANDRFIHWQQEMDELARYGKINIIVTCHVFPSKVIDPTAGEFQQWDLLLHSPKNDKTYGKRELITQWADLVGFLHEPIFVMKAGEGERMNRAVSANKGRVLSVDRTPAYVAGNRFGLTGDISIPPVNGWNYLANAVYANTGIDLFNRDV